jgi:hypothetical protein
VAEAGADRRVTTWSTVTWDTARAGGFAAYVLLTAAVSVGLVLRNRWQSVRWPRLITNELHGYLSLLALVFIAVHVLAVLVDPFTKFGLAEVLVPFVSHYRPLWMGLGVVALYLLLAVWVSSRLRARIGFRIWRAIHVLAFGVYAAATVHGLGTGSDTRTLWGPLLYAVSILLVGGLTARRLLVPAGTGQRPRPVLAAIGGAVVVVVAGWSVTGPLAAHWGARAGGAPGNPRASSARLAVGRTASTSRSSGAVTTPFGASFTGRVSTRQADESGRVTIRIDGAMHGGTVDHLEIYLRGLPLENGGVELEQSRVRMGAETPLYQGEIVGLRGSDLVASVRSTTRSLRLVISLNLAGDGSVSGTVHGTGTPA